MTWRSWKLTWFENMFLSTIFGICRSRTGYSTRLFGPVTYFHLYLVEKFTSVRWIWVWLSPPTSGTGSLCWDATLLRLACTCMVAKSPYNWIATRRNRILEDVRDRRCRSHRTNRKLRIDKAPIHCSRDDGPKGRRTLIGVASNLILPPTPPTDTAKARTNVSIRERVC